MRAPTADLITERMTRLDAWRDHRDEYPARNGAASAKIGGGR
jgi:hypothetical protein